MWIDQHHLAIGIDLAVNVRAAVTKNAVKGYGIPAWLNVGNDLIGRDVVAVPVDSHAIAALANGDIATVPANRAVTSHHAAPIRTGYGGSGPSGLAGGHNCGGYQLTKQVTTTNLPQRQLRS